VPAVLQAPRVVRETVVGQGRPPEPLPMEDVAALVQRLAVLLSAGVSPLTAWGYLLPAPDGPPTDGSSPDSAAHPPGLRGLITSTVLRRSTVAGEDSVTRIVRAAELAGARGDSIADAIAQAAAPLGGQSRDAWLGLAAAWAVATDAGSPLAACLRQLASSFRDAGQLQRDLQVAIAGPVATARLVMILPLVGLVFGALMGFDTLATLLGTVPGLVCLGVGASLMLAAHRWNARLVRRAETADASPGLHVELTAIAMSGGGSIARARALVTAAVDRYGLSAAGSDRLIKRILDLSERAGVPAVELLLSEADQQRRDARGDGQRKAATLSVTLMLPLGVCVLPAFMLVGVAPLVLSVLSSTLSAV
jgi:tight adherence protein B